MEGLRIPTVERPFDLVCGGALEVMGGLPSKSVDCIITDPPYYRVKGDFDFIWQEREAFIKEAEGWAVEMKRVLKDEGSLVWFCSDKMLGHMQVMLERYFFFLNSCTVVKTNGLIRTKACPERQRKFLVNDERFLYMAAMGEEGITPDGSGVKVLGRRLCDYQKGMARAACFKPIIDYLNNARKAACLSVEECNRILGSRMANHYFTEKSQFAFPKKADYEVLQREINGRVVAGSGGVEEGLKRDWEGLKRDYEESRRPFVIEGRQSDVFETAIDSGVCKRYGHPTVKPLKLIRRIVRAITRSGDLIIDPFMGTGTTVVASLIEGRRCLGSDIDAGYVGTAWRRVAEVGKGLFQG